MTNKEAIEQLIWVRKRICDITYSPESFEAINLAIKALEERPKGEWIERVEHRGCYLGVKTVYSYTCPFCGVKEYEKHPFCYCGADMRGDV